MLNLLKSVWNLFTGGVADIWHHVISLISAVYSYADRLYNALAHDVTSAWDAFVTFTVSVRKWVVATYGFLEGLIEKAYHDLYVWAARAIADVDNFAVSAYKWAVKEFDSVTHWVSSIVDALSAWVIKNVWQPLYNAITGALHWIEQEGNYVYDLITHPEKLVALLAAYLVSVWLTILRTWSIPIVRFILTQSRALIPDFVSLLEDVIDKVL